MHLGVVGECGDQQLRHVDRLVAEVAPQQGRPGSAGVAFGEDRVHDTGDGFPPFGDPLRCRDGESNARGADLVTRLVEALGHRVDGHEERPSDLGSVGDGQSFGISIRGRTSTVPYPTFGIFAADAIAASRSSTSMM